MRVPLQWLADYVDLEMGVDELAHMLTMSGLKVESIERIGADWQDVIIGQIIELEPHPRSTKPLYVTRVDLGSGRKVTIVTGAQNVQLHARVAVVPVGGLLPHGPDGEPMVIEPRPMVGITSHGMLASERELGISDEHSGIMILPEDVPVGAPLRSVLGDDVLDIETNPNRPDTLSIIGIAREVAAVSQQQRRLLDLDVDSNVEWIDRPSVRVEIEASELCPRYSALRIEGLSITPSPDWLVRRLELCNVRSINLPVDLTNYVMLEYGQPMHAFDSDQLHGETIVVRPARPGEELTTLDGTKRILEPDTLVIADGDRAVGLAGVMGGENSEIRDSTQSLVLESANFDPVNVRRTAQALNLRTESSSRFEKGLPPEQTVHALQRYLQLLAQTSSTPVRAHEISDVWNEQPPARRVVMPLADLDRLLGIHIEDDVAAEKLSLLGFGVVIEDGILTADVPYWRFADVERSADLVEEVARMVGYDQIPSTLFHRSMAVEPESPERRWEARIRALLLGAGLSEITTHSLTSPSAMGRLAGVESRGAATDSEIWERIVANPSGIFAQEALVVPVPLMNPATIDRQVLRVTLLPGVLDVIAHNLKQTAEELAFFECDRTYFRRAADLPYERRTLALALSGLKRDVSWQEPSPPTYTFFDVKGVLDSLLSLMRIDDSRVCRTRHPALHPGRSAALQVNGREVAYFGEMHPDVAARFDIDGWPVQVAEVDLDALLACANDTGSFHPLPRYPGSRRDIAVVVGQDVAVQDFIRIVRQYGDDILESVRVFDVYTGANLPPNTKSVALSMQFRSPGTTLTQDDVARAVDRIVNALQSELNAVLRD